jgi:hypothetical protein
MAMRINRLALGFIAVPIAIATGLALTYLEAAILGVIHPILIIVLALAGGGVVFTLADRLGWLADGDNPSILSLSDNDAEAAPPGEDGRPIVPK